MCLNEALMRSLQSCTAFTHRTGRKSWEMKDTAAKSANHLWTLSRKKTQNWVTEQRSFIRCREIKQPVHIDHVKNVTSTSNQPDLHEHLINSHSLAHVILKKLIFIFTVVHPSVMTFLFIVKKIMSSFLSCIQCFSHMKVKWAASWWFFRGFCEALIIFRYFYIWIMQKTRMWKSRIWKQKYSFGWI